VTNDDVDGEGYYGCIESLSINGGHYSRVNFFGKSLSIADATIDNPFGVGGYESYGCAAGNVHLSGCVCASAKFTSNIACASTPGTCLLEGCTFSGDVTLYDYGHITIQENANHTACTFSGNVTCDNSYGCINNSEISISDGTFAGILLVRGYNGYHTYSTASITGGTYSQPLSVGENGSITLTGGSYSTNPESMSGVVIPSGYRVTGPTAGLYTVSIHNICRIGDVDYNSLEAAFDAVTDGNNLITLTDDFTLSLDHSIAINKPCTLNLDNHAITSDMDKLFVVNGANFLIKDGQIAQTAAHLGDTVICFGTGSAQIIANNFLTTGTIEAKSASAISLALYDVAGVGSDAPSVNMSGNDASLYTTGCSFHSVIADANNTDLNSTQVSGGAFELGGTFALNQCIYDGTSTLKVKDVATEVQGSRSISGCTFVTAGLDNNSTHEIVLGNSGDTPCTFSDASTTELNNNSTGSIVINDGTFRGIVANKGAGTLSIKDGTFTNNVQLSNSAGTIAIEGGTYEGQLLNTASGTFTLEGGTYSQDPTSAATVETGYTMVKVGEQYMVVPAEITLDDEEDNAAALATVMNVTCKVTLDRPFVTGQTYYQTICLPFSLDASQLASGPLEDATIMEFLTADVSGDNITVRIRDVASIQAGVPYFIKWTSANAPITDMIFTDVTIRASLGTTVEGREGSALQFIGTLSTTTLAADQSNLFLGADNTLYWPSNTEGNNNTIKAFRAYLQSTSPAQVGMRVSFEDMPGTATDVDELSGSSVQTIKLLENGHLYILRDGVKYNAQGQIVEK